jgi:hypothetical protein
VTIQEYRQKNKHKNSLHQLTYYFVYIFLKFFTGSVTRSASGMVRGLRQAGVLVTVVSRSDKQAVQGVATGRGPDHVIAASFNTFHGLEKAVVVYVEQSRVDIGRLYCVSRCSGLLVLVKQQPT